MSCSCLGFGRAQKRHLYRFFAEPSPWPKLLDNALRSLVGCPVDWDLRTRETPNPTGSPMMLLFSAVGNKQYEDCNNPLFFFERLHSLLSKGDGTLCIYVVERTRANARGCVNWSENFVRFCF